jgi:soluble lytic murein transglycosylase
MSQRAGALSCVLTFVILSVLSNEALSLSHNKHVQRAHRADPAVSAAKQRAVTRQKTKRAAHLVAARRKPVPPVAVPVQVTTASPLSGDLAALKQTMDLVRKGKLGEAAETRKLIGDPVQQKLIEWFILRHSSESNFGRYAAFIAENPSWPSIRLLRQRAEGRLWHERSDAARVRDFTGGQPISAKGRLALARVLLLEGDRSGAERHVREAWRSQGLSEHLESQVVDAFGNLLTRDDHRARMDKRIGAKDLSGAMRAARRLGSDDIAIVKACAAVAAKASNAPVLFDAVKTEARQDLAYVLCRIDWLMAQERIAYAVQLMLAASPEAMAFQDTDEWWRKRRVLARKLLDLGEFQSAYEVVRKGAVPANENYRAEFHFMPGWIALRYLNDAVMARTHFAHVDDGSVNPIVLARANYWRGRAAEASADNEQKRAYYEAAAQHGTAYYGQLARAKLGMQPTELRPAAPPGALSRPAVVDELVHAAETLYAIGERDMVLKFVTDLAEHSREGAALAALAELTGKKEDARAMLQIGKTALTRGLPFDLYAFPDIGVPPHGRLGPDVEQSVIYSVARTESAFDQRDVSPAKAVGLMQVTPAAGRDTAKRVGVAYDWKRLVSDPVYNTQIGAAELAFLLQEYRGSHIMSFAGYNAGRGRVQQWVKQRGDPRDPKVDSVDWVERIPFAETRNYVQRVIESLQVYRVRFNPGQEVSSSNHERHGGGAREANSSGWN